MSVNAPINCTKYFTHIILTKIHGGPEYYSLKVMEDDLKDNATNVFSDLGGSGRGYYE